MGKGKSLTDRVVKKVLFSYAYVAIWIFLSFTVIMYNWPFSISLTMIHMAFCSSLAYLLINVFKLVKPVSMLHEVYLKSVMSIALMHVVVYSIGVLFKTDGFMLNMVLISIGVTIAAYGEAKFDTFGVVLYLNPITSIYYVAPYCFVFLCIPWVILVGKTSALTMNVAAVVKDMLLITFSWSGIEGGGEGEGRGKKKRKKKK
ncbi:hypothetical protein UlMin_039838 [Ulmus minor]